MCGNRAYCWKTVFTLRSCGGTRWTRRLPSSITRPAVGCSNPAIILSSVVLPQPDGPSSEKNSPAGDGEVRLLDGDEIAELLADVLQHDDVVGRTTQVHAKSPFPPAIRAVGERNNDTAAG